MLVHEVPVMAADSFEWRKRLVRQGAEMPLPLGSVVVVGARPFPAHPLRSSTHAYKLQEDGWVSLGGFSGPRWHEKLAAPLRVALAEMTTANPGA